MNVNASIINLVLKTGCAMTKITIKKATLMEGIAVEKMLKLNTALNVTASMKKEMDLFALNNLLAMISVMIFILLRNATMTVETAVDPISIQFSAINVCALTMMEMEI